MNELSAKEEVIVQYLPVAFELCHQFSGEEVLFNQAY